MDVPWNTCADWREINRSLDYLICRHLRELEPVFDLAQRVTNRLESIFPVLDDLCAASCPWCPDPCCRVARVWLDFGDLLFLHFSGQAVPEWQLSPGTSADCRFLGARGCLVPRMIRPWICTWYLCPTQAALLRKGAAVIEFTLRDALNRIKNDRKAMEEAFIGAVAP